MKTQKCMLKANYFVSRPSEELDIEILFVLDPHFAGAMLPYAVLANFM